MMAAVLVVAGLVIAAVVFPFALLAILFNVAIRLVLFPLFLIKWIVAALLMVVVGPILAIVGVVVALVCAFALSLPLVPLMVLGGIVWLIAKSNRRPAVA